MGGIILHQFEVSPFCEKVRRVLRYKGCAFKVREVPPTETFVSLRALNPAGKVPVLEHAGKVVCDSSAIALYLEEAFPEPPIFPADPKERALALLLEDWSDESLYFYDLWFRFGLPENAPEWSRRAAHTEARLFRGATEKALQAVMKNVLKAHGIGRRSPEKVMQAFDGHLGSIEAWLNGDSWLVGRGLSVADLAISAQLSCAAETGEAASVLADHPKLLVWLERVNEATGI